MLVLLISQYPPVVALLVVAFPPVAFDDDAPVSFVIPEALLGVPVIWANDVTVKVPAISEAVARIVAIANKYILFMHFLLVFYKFYLLSKIILYIC
jgi:hypothetical protein